MTHSVQSTNPREAMKRDRLWFATAVLLLLLPCLGAWGTNAYLNAYATGALSRWIKLKPLPARGVDIVGASGATVYVRAATGEHYACKHGNALARLARCWYRVRAVPVDAYWASSNQFFRKIEVRPPPTGTVSDELVAALDGAEAFSYTRYLLMQDGTVYTWHCGGGIGGWFFVGVAYVALLALGGVLVVLLWKRAGRPS